MESYKRIVSFLLLSTVISAANGARIARQASRCSPGVECVPLSSCPSLQRLLQRPSRANLLRIREALCSTDRRNTMVCCSDSSSVTTPTTPPRTTPTTPPRTTPTTPGNPGEGERLLPTNCGSSGSKVSLNRIFNGENVTIGAYPWMAILGYRVSESGPLEWGCGGALINDNYVLTAAHCIQGLPLEEVRLGEHHLDHDPDCPSCSRHQAFKVTPSQVIIHPNYDTRTTYSDDIALIRLDRKAVLNDQVWPICFPPSQFNARSFLGEREAIIAGWGQTEEGSKSRFLKQVKVPMVSLEECQVVYNNQLNNDQLCFGGVGQRDSCSGDSGGPIFHADSSLPKFTLLGVVSFGRKCGREPAIYTNAASYRNWVTQNLRP